MTSIAASLRFVLGHPLSDGRRMRNLAGVADWQIRSRMATAPIATQFVNGSVLMLRRGQTGGTGCVYVGLPEFEDMAFVGHALRRGDLFVDVGANVGAYTVIAAIVGHADVMAVEPADGAFRSLTMNIDVNGISDQVWVHQTVVGAKSGVVDFTVDRDSTNHVVQASEVEEAGRISGMAMRTLDSLLTDVIPLIAKIDVEGYELEVLRGATRMIEGEAPQALIMETNGLGRRYGFSDADVSDWLATSGFQPHCYEPWARALVLLPEPSSTGNTIFIRQPDFFADRVASAEPIGVKGWHI